MKDRKTYRIANLEKMRAQERITGARRRAKNPAAVRASAMKLKERKRNLIRAAKDRPCEDCLRYYSTHVMDLDHVRGEKLINLGLAVARGFSEAQIIAEIAKCDVVCANCHRERTHKRLQ